MDYFALAKLVAVMVAVVGMMFWLGGINRRALASTRGWAWRVYFAVAMTISAGVIGLMLITSFPDLTIKYISAVQSFVGAWQ